MDISVRASAGLRAKHEALMRAMAKDAGGPPPRSPPERSGDSSAVSDQVATSSTESSGKLPSITATSSSYQSRTSSLGNLDATSMLAAEPKTRVQVETRIKELESARYVADKQIADLKERLRQSEDARSELVRDRVLLETNYMTCSTEKAALEKALARCTEQLRALQQGSSWVQKGASADGAGGEEAGGASSEVLKLDPALLAGSGVSPAGLPPSHSSRARAQIAHLQDEGLSTVVANLDGALFEEIQNLTEQLVECKMLLAESQTQYMEANREATMLQQVNTQLSVKLQNAMLTLADLTTGGAGSSSGVAPAEEGEVAASAGVGVGMGLGGGVPLGGGRGSAAFSLVSSILRKVRS